MNLSISFYCWLMLLLICGQNSFRRKRLCKLYEGQKAATQSRIQTAAKSWLSWWLPILSMLFPQQFCLVILRFFFIQWSRFYWVCIKITYNILLVYLDYIVNISSLLMSKVVSNMILLWGGKALKKTFLPYLPASTFVLYKFIFINLKILS